MAERSDDQDPAALDVVRRFIMGFRTTQLVHVAAKLGIADLLQDGPKDAFSEQEAARLVIVERVVPEDNEPSEAKLFDINMLVVPGGLERTAAEYEKILGEAGFDLIRVIPTTSSVSVIESTPAATSM